MRRVRNAPLVRSVRPRGGSVGAPGGALVLYVLGVRRVNQRQPRHSWPAYRSVAFVAALVTTAIAIVSFIGVYDRTLFWDHMVQHLLLIMVAAPLFAIASPLRLLWRATTGDVHRVVSEALRSGPAKSPTTSYSTTSQICQKPSSTSIPPPRVPTHTPQQLTTGVSSRRNSRAIPRGRQ